MPYVALKSKHDVVEAYSVTWATTGETGNDNDDAITAAEKEQAQLQRLDRLRWMLESWAGEHPEP